MPVVVSTFYKFVEIVDCEALRASLADVCRENDVRGTILIAREGVNATVSGDENAINALLAMLRTDARFENLTDKRSRAAARPFEKLKVKIKPEIVTFGASDADPSQRVGRYVKAEDWNALLDDPNVVVVDARNVYEVAIGTFDGARDPKTRTFSEFPDFVARELAADKQKSIAMFCTGGIRCEKASSYLLGQGFQTVYHLEGGILKYLETVPKEASRWRGECFVFDARVALDHGVVEGRHTRCSACGDPIKKADDAHLCPGCACASGFSA